LASFAHIGESYECLSNLASETRTLVFYESSHRIAESLADMRLVFGDDRAAVIARELAKMFEKVLDGTLAGLHAQVEADDNQRKDEFVVMVQGVGDDTEVQLVEGGCLYAKPGEHLPLRPWWRRWRTRK